MSKPKTPEQVDFTKEIGEFIEHYIRTLVRGAEEVAEEKLELLGKVLLRTIGRGGNVFAFGNGGSDSMAEQFIYSLDSMSGKFNAFSNPKTSRIMDSPINSLFNRRLQRSGKEGDVALLVSASGNSENINNALEICKAERITTISISGGGRVGDALLGADYPLVIPVEDQQILEDIMLMQINCLAKLVKSGYTKVNAGTAGGILEVDELDMVLKFFGLRHPEPEVEVFASVASQLHALSDLVIHTFKNGGTVWMAEVESGPLAIAAEHVCHNLKWDALSEIEPRIPNRVSLGLSSAHMTGVSNDGGYWYNHILEFDDNGREGDALFLFGEDNKGYLRTAAARRIPAHWFRIGDSKESSTATLLQILGHILGRTINCKLLLERGMVSPAQFGKRLREKDLALLRQKNKTKEKMRQRYG